MTMDTLARANTTRSPPQARPAYPDHASLTHFLDRLTKRTPGSGERDETQADPRRIHHILAALDGTPSSRHVTAWAADLANAHGASVLLAHVRYAPTFLPHSWTGRQVSAVIEPAPTFLRQAEQTLRLARIGCTMAVVEGKPGPTLAKLAADVSADIVIVGTRHRSAAGRLVMGSSTEHLRQHAQTSLLIAKGPPRPDRVVLPIDSSTDSTNAALLGLEIARRARAHVHIIHARPDRPGPDDTVRYELPWLDPPGVAEARAGDPSRIVLRATLAGRKPLLLMPAQTDATPPDERIAAATWHATPASVLLTRPQRLSA